MSRKHLIRAIPSARAIASISRNAGALPRKMATMSRPSLHNAASQGIRRGVSVQNIQFRAMSSSGLPMNTGLVIVPQQEAWVIERLGKFHSVLEPGMQLLIPVVDRISYIHSLKEEAHSIPNQTAITNDNVTLVIDGVLYLRVVDAYKASYGVDDAIFAITQLAQTTMRSELGKISLDQTFKEREVLNSAVVEAIKDAADNWGISVTRYEIRDVQAPVAVKDAMDKQAEAERRKRALILASEGEQKAAINIAQGDKEARILQSEAEKEAHINEAEGHAEAARVRALASRAALEEVARSFAASGASDAASLALAEKYVEAFSKLAKESNTMLLPAAHGDPASGIATALGMFSKLNGQNSSFSADQPQDGRQ